MQLATWSTAWQWLPRKLLPGKHLPQLQLNMVQLWQSQKDSALPSQRFASLVLAAGLQESFSQPTSVLTLLAPHDQVGGMG